ncbi:MAG: hypothetical protein AB1599_05465 [Planctomycetota bacterium]
MRKYLPIPLLWFWLALGLLILIIRQVPPFSVIATDKLILAVEESKLFFLAVILPIALVRHTFQGKLAVADIVKHLAVFILLSLPLTVLASYSSCTTSGILIRSHLLLILIAATGALLCLKLPTQVNLYYLVFFILFGALPILYYLVLEFSGVPLSVLTAVNPFYLFWKIKTPEVFNSYWLYNCLIWLIAVVVLVFIRPVGMKNNESD